MKKTIRNRIMISTVTVVFVTVGTVLLACGTDQTDIGTSDGTEIISISPLDTEESVYMYSSDYQENDNSIRNNDSDNSNNSNNVNSTNYDNKNEEKKYTNQETIFVYVCGAVYAPDVYELKKDAHVIDAIKSAGGAMDYAAVDYLNLASKISDGQKIYVPTIEEIENGSFTAKETVVNNNNAGSGMNDVNDSQNNDSNGNNSGSGKININTAEISELTSIPGIGEAKAKKNIAYRNDNGGFGTIEDIMLIPGIKEGMFNKIKEYICVN